MMISKSTPVDIDSLEAIPSVNAYRSNADVYRVTNEEDPRYHLKIALWNSDDLTIFEMLDRTTPLRKNVVEVTMEIHKKCDGAHKRDGVGFNKYDVKVVSSIIAYGISHWSSRGVQKWCQSLEKYANQIHGNYLDRIFIGSENHV